MRRLKYLLYLIDWKSCLTNDYSFTGIDWLDEDRKTRLFDIFRMYHNIYDLVRASSPIINLTIKSDDKHLVCLNEKLSNSKLDFTIFHPNRIGFRDFDGVLEYKSTELLEHEKSVIDFVIKTESDMRKEKENFNWNIIKLCMSTYPEIAYSGCVKRNIHMHDMAKEYKKLMKKVP